MFRVLLLAFATLLLSGAAPAAPTTPWVNVIVRTPEGGVRQGNPNAPVRLVEYGSRSCPTCGHFGREGVGPLRTNYISTGKVSYEYREFWVHPQDPGLSALGNCVPLSRFFPLLDAMYAEQEALSGRMNQQMFDRIAKLPQLQRPRAWAVSLGYVDLLKRRGMPEAKALQCLGNAALLNQLVARVKAGVAAGVQGTPTFFVNGTRTGAYSWQQLEPELIAAGG